MGDLRSRTDVRDRTAGGEPGQEHSFPARPFDLGLDGERAFVAILGVSEQTFPEHPFQQTDCHTP
jgi:hypothetical protein